MDQNEAMEIIKTALEGYIETCLEDEEEYKQERKDLDEAWEIIKAKEKEMDKISIIWGIDDVHHIADQELSDDEAREVLRRAEHYHDASIGINWDVLDVWADMVINEREEN